LVERRKNKNHDELDGDKLISATSRFDRNCSVSETTPFAEISEWVESGRRPLMKPRWGLNCFCL
jgi:hypothetical protein